MNWSVAAPIGREILLGFRRGTGATVVVAIRRVKDDADGCAVQRRRAALRMVDRQLSKGNFKMALSLVKQLQRQPPPAGLRGFAAATQVPRRVSSVEELNLSVTETSALQLLLDPILDSIHSSLQSSSPLEEVSLESCITGEDTDLYLEDDIIEHKQVVEHEAGHFLVAYFLGVLPKKYRFSNAEDVKQDKIADACVTFVGFDFLTEANKHNFSFTVLSRFSCVIVGGLVAEHLVYGCSKGHHADVEKSAKTAAIHTR